MAKEALAEAKDEVTQMAQALQGEQKVAEAGVESPGNNATMEEQTPTGLNNLNATMEEQTPTGLNNLNATMEEQTPTGLNNLVAVVQDAAETLSDKVDSEIKVTDAITEVASQMVEEKEEGGEQASEETGGEEAAAVEEVRSAPHVVRSPASCSLMPL